MKSRTYDKEFKLNAISLHETGKSGAQICRDLGIPESTFSGWIKAFDQNGADAFAGSGNIKASEKDSYKKRARYR